MATYAIGDVQGCFDELQALLERVGFDRARDRLWFVGDLVNRGPKSLQVLRFVKELGDRAVVVLGNHDLHLLTQHEGFERKREDDTFDDVLGAPDAPELLHWVRTRSMMHAEGNFAMVHAGLLPQWTIEKSLLLAREVEQALRAPNYRDFLSNMYGSKPERWDDALADWDRLRVIVNAMTRMRFCTPEGILEFVTRGETTAAPAGFLPWFEVPGRRSAGETLVCGHWSALGLLIRPNLLALDMLQREARIAGASRDAVDIYVRLGSIDEGMLLDVKPVTAENLMTRFGLDAREVSGLNVKEGAILVENRDARLNELAERYVTTLDSALDTSYQNGWYSHSPFYSVAEGLRSDRGVYSSGSGLRSWSISVVVTADDFPLLVQTDTELAALRAERNAALAAWVKENKPH